MLCVRSILATWLLAATCCVAQEKQTPPPDGGASGMTLHVTVKELQVAALVLDMHRKPVPDLEKSRFRLQVDSDKPFSPVTVHREGNDPISLAILIDASKEHTFHAHLADAIATMREQVLLPHDRLLLFATDCGLVTYRGDAVTPEGIRRGVNQILANPSLHRGSNRSSTCENKLRLWDSAMLVLHRLSTAPGRHAMLMVSDGRDVESVTKMSELSRYATITATTMFALPSYDVYNPNMQKNPYEVLVLRTGGQMLDPPARNKLDQSLIACVGLLRERYILGFNQPQNAKAGDHAIQAMVQHSSYVIRTSGVSVPLAFADEVTQTVGQDASSDLPSSNPNSSSGGSSGGSPDKQ